MRKGLMAFVAIIVSTFCQFSYAAQCVQNGNQLISLVGLDNKDGTVFAFVNSSSNECSCTYVRFKPANTDTKMALSILLSAKMSNSKVRVDLLDSNDCGSAFRVYLQ